jgi:hypothetical protein
MEPTLHPETISQALQLSTSPVILISACGLIMLSMTNRLGRAIDRARALARESKSNRKAQIAILVRRARWIRYAILLNTLCIGLTSLLVLALFTSIFLAVSLQFLMAAMFIAGIACLLGSLVCFIIDISTSLHAMETDLEQLDGE